MERTKLGICIKDIEYQSRFVKCILNHYKELYEVHVVEDECSDDAFDAIIIDENYLEKEKLKEFPVVLVLEENDHPENTEIQLKHYYTPKYQEVYKIVETLEKELLKNNQKRELGRKNIEAQVIGVVSLDKANLQVPFMTLLAETIGERSRVLVIDIQPYSGFATELCVEEGCLGMEDMIALATTESYTINRLRVSIGHEQKWDYIYPAKNSLCLAELTISSYQKLIEILQKEMGYDCLIVNFGTLFLGNISMMELCQTCYFLTDRKEERSWRERCFIESLRSKEEHSFLNKIIWMQMPKVQIREYSWRIWMKNWLWGELGDEVRNMNWVDSIDA